MKLIPTLLLCAVAFGQTATLTVTQQPAPFPLSKGLNLYSAEVCTPVARAFSFGQIRQAVEGLGIAVMDPALNAQAIAQAQSRTPTAKALTAIKWLSAGMSVSSAAISYVKQQGTYGNGKTWAIVATGTGALGAGIGILQPFIQGEANAQATALTSGVSAALMQADGLWALPADGCIRGMLFGSGGKMINVGRIE